MSRYYPTVTQDGTPGAPGYPERWGDEITTVRQLTAAESDLDETGHMYVIRFADGVTCHAFEDELALEPRAVAQRIHAQYVALSHEPAHRT